MFNWFKKKAVPSGKHYGWIPQKPDPRDFKFKITPALTLPPLVNLRSSFYYCYDQGELGSCVLNAAAGVIEYDLDKQGLLDMMPSRLFMYWNTRKMEGTVNQDSGCEIRDAVKSINQKGTCNEILWPYIISKFTKKPSCKCYKVALNDRAVKYEAVNQTMTDMKSCLVMGFPFIIGISVYDSFESDEVAKTGIVPMPKSSENLLGGHALVVVGYDDSKQWWIVRNSWGTKWGDNGYCYLPYQYLTNTDLSSDFWVITTIGK